MECSSCIKLQLWDRMNWLIMLKYRMHSLKHTVIICNFIACLPTTLNANFFRLFYFSSSFFFSNSFAHCARFVLFFYFHGTAEKKKKLTDFRLIFSRLTLEIVARKTVLSHLSYHFYIVLDSTIRVRNDRQLQANQMTRGKWIEREPNANSRSDTSNCLLLS